MEYNPRQLWLIPEHRFFGKQVYRLGMKCPNMEYATGVARNLRRKYDHKVRITKGDDGLYDLWIKVDRNLRRFSAIAGIMYDVVKSFGESR